MQLPQVLLHCTFQWLHTLVYVTHSLLFNTRRLIPLSALCAALQKSSEDLLVALWTRRYIISSQRSGLANWLLLSFQTPGNTRMILCLQRHLNNIPANLCLQEAVCSLLNEVQDDICRIAQYLLLTLGSSGFLLSSKGWKPNTPPILLSPFRAYQLLWWEIKNVS